MLSCSYHDIGGTSTTEGRITLSGQPVSRAQLRKVTSYVPQVDILLPSLTVRESIAYSALLRLPRDTSNAQIISKVDQVLDELGLTEVSSVQKQIHRFFKEVVTF